MNMNFMLEKYKINISIEKSVWIENRQDLFVELLVSVEWSASCGWVDGWMNERKTHFSKPPKKNRIYDPILFTLCYDSLLYTV